MTARERLESYQRIRRKILTKSDHIDELETVVNKATPQMSDLPRGSYDPHRRERILAELIDLKDDLIDEVKELIEEEKFIRNLIENLEDDHAEILEMRYLNGRTWAEISETFGLTPRQIYRIRDKALDEIESGSKWEM